MTIVFYYWFSSLMYFVPMATYTTYRITFSAFLIVASREKCRETLHRNRFLTAAIINIVSTVLLFFFPFGIGYSGPTAEEMVMVILFIMVNSLITHIPGIISYGLVFFNYGHKNRRQIGNYLKYSGLFWLIFSIWASISLFSPFNNMSQLPWILDTIFNFPTFLVIVVLQQILSIGNWFSVLANFFLLLHAFLNKDRTLKIAGFIHFIWQATIVLSFIPSYLWIYL